jgi:hypothetical protein
VKEYSALLACLLVATAAFGQDQAPSIDAGVQVRGIAVLLNDTAPGGADAPTGIGGTFNVGLTSRLSLTTQATWFPTPEKVEFQSQGGRTLEASLGLRVKLVQSRAYSISAGIAPGLIHFTNAIIGSTDVSFVEAPVTHLTLNGGLGLEFYPTRRLIARIDYSGSVYRTPAFYFQSTLQPSSVPGIFLSSSSYAPPATYFLDEVTFGLGYRLGPLSPRMPEKETSTAGSQRPHRFLDAPNVVLIAAEVGALLADGIETELAFKRSPNTFVEEDPIARPFVRAGWPGMVLSDAIFAGGTIAVQYLLHRTNHHRAERLSPILFTAYEIPLVIDWAHILSHQAEQ